MMRWFRLLMAAAAVSWIVSCGGGSETPFDESTPALRVGIEPTTVVARQNESVTVRVDVPNVLDIDLPSGYAFDLDEVVGKIDVTTAPCPQGAGSRACEDWTITSRADSVPGVYDVSVKTIGSRAGTGRESFQLKVVLNPAPAYGAAVSVASHTNGAVLVLNDSGQVFVRGPNYQRAARTGYRRLSLDTAGVDSNIPEPGTVDEFVPAPLPPGRWISVDVGASSSHAVRDDGGVWAWGTLRQFGSVIDSAASGVPVVGLTNVRSLAVTSFRRYGLLADGRVLLQTPDGVKPVCEDNNGPGTMCLREITQVRALAGSESLNVIQFLFLKSDGTVWTPFNTRSLRLTGPAVQAIALNRHSEVFVALDGTVWWREFEGDPDVTVPVAGLTEIVAVSASARHHDAYALRRDGTVWTWRLGATDPTGVPRQVPRLANVVALGDNYAISGDCGAAGGALWRITEGLESDVYDAGTTAIRIPGFGEGSGCTPPLRVAITVSVTGEGRVVSAPARIDCAGTCTGSFAFAEEVQLHAAPAPGWRFSEWRGDPGCPSGLVSSGGIAATSNRNCEAVFVPGGERRLEVRVEGGGRVTSAPEGVNCGNDCAESYRVNAVVQLASAAALGYRFAGYSGHNDCADGALTMDGVRSCVVRFVALPAPAAPTGFTATAATSAVELRWDSGNGAVVRYRLERADGSGNFITIDNSVDGAATSFIDGSAAPITAYTYRLTAINLGGESAPATASVTTLPQTRARLTVTVSGTGSVTSTPAGIACTSAGGDCSEVYPANAQVMLTATPGAGFLLEAFGGDADCSDGVVTLTADLSCRAFFVAATGQGWVQLGGAPLTTSDVLPVASLALDGGGVPHAAHLEAVPAGDVARLRVQRFNGAVWQPLGAALNAGAITPASDPSLAFSPAAVLHLAWSQGNGIQQNVFVARFNGTAWESVGAVGVPLNYIAGSRAVGPSLGFDANGLPMVAWIENNAVKFKRFTGVAWVPAQGSGGAEGPVSDSVHRVQLSSLPAGVPVIAWSLGTGTAQALKVVRDFDFAPLGAQVNAPLAAGTAITEFGVLGGVPDAVALVTWVEQSAGTFSVRASRWDGQWIAFSPIVNASTDSFTALAMARNLAAVAVSSISASADLTSLQVAARTSGFSFDPFGSPLTGPRSAALRTLTLEMATATRPIVAGVRVNASNLHELHVYGYFP